MHEGLEGCKILVTAVTKIRHSGPKNPMTVVEPAITAVFLFLEELKIFSSPIRSCVYRTNLYPTPWTVRRCRGRSGTASIFWRSRAMKLSTVRVVG